MEQNMHLHNFELVEDMILTDLPSFQICKI